MTERTDNTAEQGASGAGRGEPGGQGGDQGERTGAVPNPETGVGLGAGEESTFEPEEDPESTPDG